MKKSLVLLTVALFSMLWIGQVTVVAGDSKGKLPPPIKIENTVWKGSMTYVTTAGAVTTSDNCTVSFGDRTDYFFSGGFQDPVTTSNSFDFSGIIGPLDRKFLHIGGVDHVAFADVTRPFKGNLFMRGHNTSTGVSYMGRFELQKSD